ncbi:hypothetical protein B5X24_HaOG213893 [Helicoverpa armigera]|nr:hypothetical protein B5X24_HaOG213893 [Helicoverpa armigera]
MCLTLFGGFFIINIITVCCAQNTTLLISFFEYGVHVEGEEVSFASNGYIPLFTPMYTLNVTPVRPDLEKRFTYLRAEYVSPMSTVDVVYNPDAHTMAFYIRFPFLNIPYGVVGYSTKILRSRIWTSWRKSKGH